MSLPNAFTFRRLKDYADWKLLLFLVLFMDVKLAVKVLAIVLIYLLQFDFKFGFRFKNSRLPLFYPMIIGVAILNSLLFVNFINLKYDLVLLNGIGFWILCILALHQVKLAIDRNDPETLHRTITLFFLLNVIISVLTLAGIIWEIKAINPYTYQGLYQKYFIGTGDYIKGITFDVSVTNSVLSAIGVIYFLYRTNAVMLLLCMLVLLLSGSNSLNLLLVVILIAVLIFDSSRNQKSLIVTCFTIMAVFLIKVSPHNSNYAVNALNKALHKRSHPIVLVSTHTTPIVETADSLLNADERREKVARVFLEQRRIALLPKEVAKAIDSAKAPVTLVQKVDLPKPNLDTQPYWEAPDTSAMRYTLLKFISQHQAQVPIAADTQKRQMPPGKVIALKQMARFFARHPLKILTGNGLGNFSSKIALKATGLGFTGGYPLKYAYINPDFLANHFDVYLYFFSKEPGLHSVTNSPNSVYYQLLGEYGIIGLLAFFACYLWYFLKHYRHLSYGIPLLVLLLSVFLLEYWFEQLSVVVFVELLLMVNIKEAEIKNFKPHVV